MLHYNLSERYSFLLRTGNKTSMASTPPWLAAAAARLLDDAALSSESSSPSPPSGLRARGQSITGASRFQYLDQHSPRLSPRPWHCPRPEDHQRVLRFMDGGQRWSKLHQQAIQRGADSFGFRVRQPNARGGGSAPAARGRSSRVEGAVPAHPSSSSGPMCRAHR